MKKRFLIPVITLILVLAASLAAYANDKIYANKDKVNVYEDADDDSDVIKTLKGGEYGTLLDADDKWIHIALDSDLDGWVNRSEVTNSMPPEYCKHEWSDWTTTQDATCTSNGTMVRKCTICEASEGKDIPALGHAFGGWQVTVQPTCTSEGQQTSTCSRCGAQETQSIGRIAHNFGKWTVTQNPTCTKEGSRTRTCSMCGTQETQSIECVPHDYREWKIVKEATCTAEGARTRTCKTCGREDRQVIEKLPHEFGEWKVLRKPTCTKKGKQSHVCKNCGYEETVKTDKLPHNFETKILVEATDHSSGVRTRVCKDCGFTEEKQEYDPEGTLRRGDSNEKVRELQQLLADQNYLNDGGADGIFGAGTEMAVMKFQNDQGLTPDGIAWPQTIKRLQHDFGPWEVITPLTRDTAGERVRKCKECSYEQHETIPLTPFMQSGDRGPAVRAVQQMLTSMGYDAGNFDGIYGQKLDAAYSAFAAEHDITFEPGKLLPSHLDTLVSSWTAAVPEEEWRGKGGLDTPVNLALTVTPVQEAYNKEDDVLDYSWTLTNMGTEPCTFTALLLSYEDDTDFRDHTMVIVLDGENMEPNCANSISGSFEISRDWGGKNLHFSALAVSDTTGAKWLSNVNDFEIRLPGETEAETETEMDIETEAMTENITEAETAA